MLVKNCPCLQKVYNPARAINILKETYNKIVKQLQEETKNRSFSGINLRSYRMGRFLTKRRIKMVHKGRTLVNTQNLLFISDSLSYAPQP